MNTVAKWKVEPINVLGLPCYKIGSSNILPSSRENTLKASLEWINVEIMLSQPSSSIYFKQLKCLTSWISSWAGSLIRLGNVHIHISEQESTWQHLGLVSLMCAIRASPLPLGILAVVSLIWTKTLRMFAFGLFSRWDTSPCDSAAAEWKSWSR